MTREAGEAARPLPPLQNDMAELVDQGVIFYSAARARWYEGEAGTTTIGRERGRALRAMMTAGAIETFGGVDGRSARRVRLTEVGRSRYTPAE